MRGEEPPHAVPSVHGVLCCYIVHLTVVHLRHCGVGVLVLLLLSLCLLVCVHLRTHVETQEETLVTPYVPFDGITRVLISSIILYLRSYHTWASVCVL